MHSVVINNYQMHITCGFILQGLLRKLLVCLLLFISNSLLRGMLDQQGQGPLANMDGGLI